MPEKCDSFKYRWMHAHLLIKWQESCFEAEETKKQHILKNPSRYSQSTTNETIKNNYCITQE